MKVIIDIPKLTEMLINAVQIQSYNMMNKTDGEYNAENG